MRFRKGGAWRDVESGFFRFGASWKRLVRGEYFDGSQWKQIASFVPPLSASIDPNFAGGTRNSPGIATTNPVTASPTGGQAPYSYVWELISGSLATANNPNSATTTFSASVGSDDNKTSTFRCAITDAIGQTASAEIIATFTSLDVDLEN